jgi:gallate decarboxylase subunit D
LKERRIRAVKSFTVSEKKGRFEVHVRVDVMDRDILVTLTGGAIHIGAIGIGQPRPSLSDPKKISATGSVFTFLGHKEDTVAKSLSEELAARLNSKVVVVAGIHWDGLKIEEIQIITEICQKLTERITNRVAGIQNHNI